MFKPDPRYKQWVRDTRMPTPPPPPGSCCSQFHIYEDPDKYPTRPSPPYEAIDATFADAKKMLHALGFERGVIVHPTVYGSDHRLLLDTLEGLTSEERKSFRGVAIIDDSVSDRELERLNAAGVCGARLNIARAFTLTPSKTEARRTLDRLREIGWHARVHVTGNDLLEFSDILRSVKDVPMVIDHLGHVHFEGGFERPVVRWILDMLQHENWWMMTSNGNRDSTMESGWDDAVPYGRAFIRAAPDRMVWATDWPHAGWTKRMMNDAEEVELLYRYVDYDPALIRKILVDNPARLHGFTD